MTRLTTLFWFYDRLLIVKRFESGYETMLTLKTGRCKEREKEISMIRLETGFQLLLLKISISFLFRSISSLFILSDFHYSETFPNALDTRE